MAYRRERERRERENGEIGKEKKKKKIQLNVGICMKIHLANKLFIIESFFKVLKFQGKIFFKYFFF